VNLLFTVIVSCVTCVETPSSQKADQLLVVVRNSCLIAFFAEMAAVA